MHQRMVLLATRLTEGRAKVDDAAGGAHDSPSGTPSAAFGAAGAAAAAAGTASPAVSTAAAAPAAPAAGPAASAVRSSISRFERHAAHGNSNNILDHLRKRTTGMLQWLQGAHAGAKPHNSLHGTQA